MIISRKVEFTAAALAELQRAGISMDDDRVQAAIWYLKHDTRLDRLRRVGSSDAQGSTSGRGARARPSGTPP